MEREAAHLELIYRVSRELASDLDLKTVLQRVLHLSLEAVGGISGSLIVLDEKGQPIDAALVYAGRLVEPFGRELAVTLDSGLAGWVRRNRHMVLLADTSLDPRWVRRPDDAPDKTGPKSALCIPLIAHEAMVGVMTLVHPTPGFFKDEHGALMQIISDQAGIAILNARLFSESQRRSGVLLALVESAQALTGALGMDQILNSVLQQTQRALNVEAVSLGLITPDRRSLVFTAASGGAAEQMRSVRLNLGQGIAGWVAEHGEAVLVDDAQSDPRFYPEVDRQFGFNTRAIVCAPIRSQGEIIGVLEAINPLGGGFGPDALAVLSGIGSLAGSVIRHGQLFDQLEAAHRSYRELFEDSLDMIVITEPNGRITQANRQAVRLTGLETLSDSWIFDLQTPPPELSPAALMKRVQAGATVSYETSLQGPEEIERTIRVDARRIILEHRPVVQWIVRDISERKRLETLREDLLSMVYHDLRSPLSNVINSLEMLSSLQPADESTSLALLGIALRAAQRIQRLTGTMLDLKSLEAGQPLVNREPADLAVLLTEAIEIIRPLASGKRQTLVLHKAPDGAAMADADAELIRRVMINLLENAVKYSPAGSKIQAEARPLQEDVQVWIEDEGPGIPADQHDLIFDKYSRLRPDGVGFGLGLAFCRMAVQAHGGRIWVESVPAGGSRFLFTLPPSPGEGA